MSAADRAPAVTRTVRALVVEPGRPSEVREIVDSLESLQELVGGYIQVVRASVTVFVVCDEEGKLYGKPINFYLPGGCDLIVGTAVLIAEKGERFRSLTDVEVQLARELVGR